MPDQKEAHFGTGDDENREQAVHLPHQEVGMALEGDREQRGRSARREVPHLRRDAPGAGLGVAHPVGSLREGREAPAGPKVEHPFQLAAAIEPRTLDALPVAL